MKRLIGLLVAIVLAAMAVITAMPGKAFPATMVVYVEDHTGAAWPVHSAMDYVDQFTGSDLVYGSCRTGYQCIRVYERTVQSKWAAITCMAGMTYSFDGCGAATPYTRVYVNPQRNSYSYGYRLRVITHELGHTRGITWHSTTCTNVMYAYATCPGGGLAPYRFSDAQKAVLKGH